MNIIYLITNLDKKEGEMRFYVGSKQECHIETINGLDTIIGDNSGFPYWGSSSHPLMKEELKTQRFSATVLESTGHRKELLALEQKWMDKLDAVRSQEYYNLSSAKLRGGMPTDKNVVVNRYGEEIHAHASLKASFMKRHNNAKNLGFESFGHFVMDFIEKRSTGRYMSDIAKEYALFPGAKISVCRLKHLSRDYDLKVVDLQFKKVTPQDIEVFREMVFQNASIRKISEFTGYCIPVISYYISDILSTNKQFIVAARRNQTQEELETQIFKEVLDGLSIAKASRKLQITETSGNRYFYRALRKRLKSSDL